MKTAQRVAKLCSWNISGVQVKFLDLLHIAENLEILDGNIDKIVTSMNLCKDLNFCNSSPGYIQLTGEA